ncbi:MAG TPA: hypothetical protein VI753_16415 [Anaerolineales bacterium]|nr:hypothetical protein [Anaerolineales bacterium]
MTQLSIQINNADIVRRGLQDLSAEIPKIGRLQIYQTSQAIVRRMKIYPPERPGQRYIRTGRLGGGWMIIPNTNGYTTRNDTPYTKYVVGNAYGLEQAWMHEGRWNLLRDVQEEEVAKLPKAIEEEITMVTRRVGL